MLNYIKTFIKTFNKQLIEFISFLMDKNIFQIGLAFILASQINKLFVDFISSIITPITNSVISEEDREKPYNVLGIKFQTLKFLMSLINFIIVMVVLFYFYKLSDYSKTYFEKVTTAIKSLFISED